MQLQKYQLVRLKTVDGFCEMRRGVKLGTEYLVDETDRKWQEMYNVEFEVRHMKEIGTIYDENEVRLGWLPMELLEEVKDEEAP